MSNKVSLHLSKAEAIVLFEWLAERSQASDDGGASLSPEDLVLASIENQLEKTLVEPFTEDYETILKAARAQVAQDW